MLNILWESCKGTAVTGVGGMEQRRKRVCPETKIETVGTDWSERQKVSLLSLPEGGMFVPITRCSQATLRIPKEGLRQHRLNSMS